MTNRTAETRHFNFVFTLINLNLNSHLWLVAPIGHWRPGHYQLSMGCQELWPQVPCHQPEGTRYGITEPQPNMQPQLHSSYYVSPHNSFCVRQRAQVSPLLQPRASGPVQDQDIQVKPQRNGAPSPKTMAIAHKRMRGAQLGSW